MAKLEEVRLSVQTPRGVIQAVPSPDKNNPGIVLMLIGNDGKEKGSCTIQYLEEEQDVKASVFDERTDEPVYERWMV